MQFFFGISSIPKELCVTVHLVCLAQPLTLTERGTYLIEIWNSSKNRTNQLSRTNKFEYVKLLLFGYLCYIDTTLNGDVEILSIWKIWSVYHLLTLDVSLIMFPSAGTFTSFNSAVSEILFNRFFLHLIFYLTKKTNKKC